MKNECPINKPRKRRKNRKDLEAAVLRECLDYLAVDPRVIYVERRNTGAVKLQSGGYIRFGHKGAADIFCIVKDIIRGESRNNGEKVCFHIEIECKRRQGGKQSKVQKEFQEFCDSHGIPYILATSAEELKEKLNSLLTGN